MRRAGVLPAACTRGEIRIVGQPASRATRLAAARACCGARRRRSRVTGFSLDDLVATSPAAALARSCAARCRTQGSTAVAEVPIDRLDDPELTRSAPRARRRPAGAATDGRHAARTIDRAARSSSGRATSRQAVGGFRAFAPLPRIMSGRAAVDRLRRREAGGAGAGCSSGHPIDPGGLGALWSEARAGRADDGRRRRRRRGGGRSRRTSGTRRSPLEEITRNIRAAALEPVERDGRFEA